MYMAKTATETTTCRSQHQDLESEWAEPEPPKHLVNKAHDGIRRKPQASRIFTALIGSRNPFILSLQLILCKLIYLFHLGKALYFIKVYNI